MELAAAHRCYVRCGLLTLLQVGSPEAEDLAFSAEGVIVTLSEGLADAKAVVNGAFGATGAIVGDPALVVTNPGRFVDLAAGSVRCVECRIPQPCGGMSARHKRS